MQALSGPEKGFLLLSSKLGVPERKTLTVAQLRTLARRAIALPRGDGFRELEPGDLTAAGCSLEAARHIWSLLQEEQLLHYYLEKSAKAGCTVLTRASRRYPLILRKRLGLDSPGCLWGKGDFALLDTPAVALVGSRDLQETNREFAREVGIQAARQGYTLVSGNARGADKIAQQACLAEGGRVISVVADSLESHRSRDRVLYLSEDGFELAFSAGRALSRNRVIHCLGQKTFVAQATLHMGGTWDGTVKNLRHGWSSVFCFDDGTPACRELEQLGAVAVGMGDLEEIGQLQSPELSVFSVE